MNKLLLICFFGLAACSGGFESQKIDVDSAKNSPLLVPPNE